MVSGPSRSTRRLRLWILVRLPIILILLLVMPRYMSVLTGFIVERASNPHGAFKVLIECWGLLLLQLYVLPQTLLVAGVAGAVLALLRGRLWLIAAGVISVLALSFFPMHQLVAVVPALVLFLLAFLPPWLVNRYKRVYRGALWIPGTEFWLSLAAYQLLVRQRWRGVRALLALPAALGIAGACWFASSLMEFENQKHVPEFVDWPDNRVDSRVLTLERAPNGVVGEYHEIQVAGDYAYITAEGTGRLIAAPVAGGELVTVSIPPRHVPNGGIGSVSLYTEPDGTSWIMTDFSTLSGLRVEDGRWIRTKDIYLPGRTNFPYLRWAADTERLFLVDVDAMSASPGQVMSTSLDGSSVARQCMLANPDGSRFGAPRDAVWVPTISRLVAAPDYDEWLYAVDPDTCIAEPWLETDSFNGRVVWVPEWERLIVAKPNESVVLVVDPVTASVEREIQTQRGVRVVAVDAQRDLLVTASVLTGNVLVQRAEDGKVIDRFGRVMPMVRYLALDPASGQAFLSTWTVLYQIPYLSSVE